MEFLYNRLRKEFRNGQTSMKGFLWALERVLMCLWQKLDSALEVKGDKVKIKWVKGHALPKHINGGLTTEESIWGNNEAVALARDCLFA